MYLIMKIHKLRVKYLAKRISKLQITFNRVATSTIKEMEIIEKKSKAKERALTKAINELLIKKAHLLDKTNSYLDEISKDRNDIIELKKDMFKD